MYKISTIQEVVSGVWHINNDTGQIDTILQDSRKLENASTTLFFAIKGERLDGHDYLQEMYNLGVRNFVVQHNDLTQSFKDANYVIVKNSLDAMQKLVTFHRSQYSLPVVAITGSNGKTIVKEWCHQLLHKDYNICRSPKSYNSQLGVPLSVWALNKKNTLALFEAGISQPGEMEKLEKIIQPNIGIFTTISSAHSENFINEAHKIKEKLRLFINVDVLIYCADINPLNPIIKEVFGNTTQLSKFPNLLTWGESEDAVIKIVNKEISGNSSRLKISYNKEEFQIEIPFADYSSIQNAMHCVALMLHLNKDEAAINQGLLTLQRVAMRLEQKKGNNDTVIINDSYNSDIDSLRIALEFLQQQKHHQNKTLILSDILQSGMTGVDLYGDVNDLLLKNKINKFIAIGENLKRHQFVFKIENFKNGILFFDTTQDFLNHIYDDEFQHETILLKGARKFEFEKISAALEEKAHATVLEIDLNAVLNNLKVFTAQLQPGTKVMVMVKAFSYGASAVEIAKMLEFNRVDYLGVAYADEGVTLRKAGVSLPIMVLNPEERSFHSIIKFKLEPEIYSFELLSAFSEAVKNSLYQGKYPVHIDLDTGMKRLGFDPSEVDQLISVLEKNDNLEVKSIFSHLAGADEAALDEFTEEQITLFDTLSQKIAENIKDKPLRHLANSSGISRFKNAHFDMVRLGIGLYGFNEQLQNQIQTVTSLKTTISQIKPIKKGESIGYGRKGKADKDMVIATIAIGYADGLNRLLSNGVGEVFLNNQRAPIIGNICMDMAMIDISHIPETKVGDNVEIFGENISANEIAQKINTIPYEVLTSVSERVKRVFFMD